jgi:hypothetical protein
MGFLDKLLGGGNSKSSGDYGLIETGRNKNAGGHDHRTNTGNNRTPAQKEGDKRRHKD